MKSSHPLDRLRELEAAAQRLREKESRARAKAEKLERKIAGLREASGLPAPPSAATSPTASPTGVHAIRRLFEENPKRVWSVAEIHPELEGRGWISTTSKHPRQGVEAAVSRLVRRGEVERLDRGRYRAADTPTSPVPEPARGARREAPGAPCLADGRPTPGPARPPSDETRWSQAPGAQSPVPPPLNGPSRAEAGWFGMVGP